MQGSPGGRALSAGHVSAPASPYTREATRRTVPCGFFFANAPIPFVYRALYAPLTPFTSAGTYFTISSLREAGAVVTPFISSAALFHAFCCARNMLTPVVRRPPYPYDDGRRKRVWRPSHTRSTAAVHHTLRAGTCSFSACRALGNGRKGKPAACSGNHYAI